MWDSGNTFDAEVVYAMRMVQLGYATVEQAAASCGVEPAALQARLASGSPASVQALERDKFFAGRDR